jgi:alpha-tubulin suppressor-like RCC1 family protein
MEWVFSLHDFIFAHHNFIFPQKALTVEGQIFCWGTSNFGITGTNKAHGIIVDMASIGPVLITSTARPIQLALDTHACALYSHGKVICWGRNGSQQIGNNNPAIVDVGDDSQDMTNAVFLPLHVILDAIPIIAVSVGRYHSCALFEIGRMMCWGGNDENMQLGQLGRPNGSMAHVGNRHQNIYMKNIFELIENIYMKKYIFELIAAIVFALYLSSHLTFSPSILFSSVPFPPSLPSLLS